MKFNIQKFLGTKSVDLKISEEKINTELNVLYENNLPNYSDNTGYQQIEKLIKALIDMGYENFNGSGKYHILKPQNLPEGHSYHYSNDMSWYQNNINLKKMLEKAYIVLKDTESERIKTLAKSIEMECMPGCISKIANFFQEATVDNGESYIANFKEVIIYDYIKTKYKDVFNIHSVRYNDYWEITNDQDNGRNLTIHKSDAFEVHNIAGVVNRIYDAFNIAKSADTMPTTINIAIADDFERKIKEEINNITPQRIIDALYDFFALRVILDGEQNLPSLANFNNQVLTPMRDFMKDIIEVQGEIFYTEDYANLKDNYKDLIKDYVILYLSKLGYITEVNEAEIEAKLGINQPEEIVVDAPENNIVQNDLEDEETRRIREEAQQLNNINEDIVVHGVVQQLQEITQENHGVIRGAINAQREVDVIAIDPIITREENHIVAERIIPQDEERIILSNSVMAVNSYNNYISNIEYSNIHPNPNHIISEHDNIITVQQLYSETSNDNNQDYQENEVVNNNITQENIIKDLEYITYDSNNIAKPVIITTQGEEKIYTIDNHDYHETEIVRLSNNESKISIKTKPVEIAKEVFSNIKTILEVVYHTNYVASLVIQEVVFQHSQVFTTNDKELVQNQIEASVLHHYNNISQNGAELLGFIYANDIMV